MCVGGRSRARRRDPGSVGFRQAGGTCSDVWNRADGDWGDAPHWSDGMLGPDTDEGMIRVEGTGGRLAARNLP